MSEELKIEGRLTFYEGDKIIFGNVKNHITMAGLTHFASIFISRIWNARPGGYGSTEYTLSGSLAQTYMAAGTNANPTTVTINSITDAKNSTNVTGTSIIYDDIEKRWKIIFTGAWSSGILPTVISEFGFYQRLFTNMTVYDENNPGSGTLGVQIGPNWLDSGALVLFARVSIGDGQEGFDRPASTSPNETYSLQWEILI
jgi:hypothetical protein